MACLIAVDWGTSSLRAALLDNTGKVLAKVASDQGVSSIVSGAFEQTLYPHIAPWLTEYGDLPVLMCGMIGGSIGWQEVPYQPVPIQLETLARHLVPVSAKNFSAWIVPGVCGASPWDEPDMMRGEESQIVGWLQTNTESGQAILCLPGTHTKWARVVGRQLQDFSTAFTGEVFALLKRGSVLVRGEQVFDQDAFLQGVARTAEGVALNHVLFSVRSRVLAGTLNGNQAAAYLSGLLLGAEIAGYKPWLRTGIDVHIIGAPEISQAYQWALQAHQITSWLYSGDEQVFAGLYALAQPILLQSQGERRS